MRTGDGPHRKIGEVAALLKVKPHVLRYWESEFPMLRPKKTRGHHRMYSPRDVALVQAIQRLLDEEGFTIAGARRFLASERRQQRKAPASVPSAGADAKRLREGLLELRRSLVGFLHQLDHEGVVERPVSVRVEQMVQAPTSGRTTR